jgi:hypothetical protein
MLLFLSLPSYTISSSLSVALPLSLRTHYTIQILMHHSNCFRVFIILSRDKLTWAENNLEMRLYIHIHHVLLSLKISKSERVRICEYRLMLIKDKHVGLYPLIQQKSQICSKSTHFVPILLWQYDRGRVNPYLTKNASTQLRLFCTRHFAVLMSTSPGCNP